MRIISGTARGTKLNTLDGISTRPTLDRVKESLFSIIQSKIQDACVLDLFAGSGALGLECLSRGAKKAFFCDSNIDAIKIINSNLEKTRLSLKSCVYHKEYKKCLEKLKEEKLKFDLIFLDPPYKTFLVNEALKKIEESDLLQNDGIIIIETDEEEIIKKIKKESNFYDQRKYGRVTLLFLNRKG